jgi:LmbE family N-acetylglucosaminyl deacetylase
MSALALCGIGSGQSRCLGHPDQQAALRLADLIHELAELFLRLRPEAVLTHPNEGGHPDHDATALAAHAAAALLRRNGDRPPALVEMTSYHNGPHGITPCEFLPSDNCNVATVRLTADERRFKQRLFDCFATQQGTLRYFPTDTERFRPAPAYDFTAPPHPGKLFYECFDWGGMTGPRFCALAADALAALGLGGRP